ncbi:MAG: segregation ATPase FtsK/SpoIIIE, family, partial [Acidimicrobiaceae bacterium]
REIATFGGFPGEVRLQRGDRGKVLDPVIAEQLTVPAADRAALNLAVRHHVHEGDVADLAPSATFAEVLGVDVLTPLAIGMRWDAAPPSPTFTLGTGVLAGIEVALDDTHPHLVVLGADADRRFDVITGWLVSLAVTHPPEDLAIVLVADGDRLAAGPAAELPHVVGVATTDATGVGARAMAALALGLDSRALGQASSVPTVVVVDVDALTVDPELTENLVELVRRGPTVGVHLLVSGVGPTELVAELRDAHASSVVLEAAPSTIARLGLGTSTVAVRLPGSSSTSDVHAPEVRPFPAPPTADGRSDVGTDLDGAASDTLRLSTRAQLRPIVDTVVDASRGRSAEPASRLRLEPLGNRYQLSDVAELLELTGEAGAPDEKGVAVGVLDDLITGRHAPWVLDAVDAGVVLIEGGPGSGRTTLLQTLAAALAQSRSSGELWLLGLDGGGGGLGALRTLPHCVGVVDADEIAELERLAGTLGRYIEHRRHATSEPDPETQPQVVVLIDELGVVLERLEGSDERLAQDLTRALVAAAKDDGIGLVITSDDGTLPVELADRVGHRVVLTGGDDSDVPPGRAVDEGRPVQVALPGEAAPDAMEVFAALADRLSGDAVWAVPLLRPMPTEVERRELPSPTPGATDVPLGVDAWTLEAAWCRLHRTPTFAVIGPVGSGRSTALSTIVQGLAEAREGMEAYLLAPRPSRLVGLSCWWERGIGLEDSIELAALLADEAKEREPGAYPPMLVVVDDAGELASGAGADALAALLDRSRAGVTMVLAAASPSALAAGGPSWLRELWDRHHGLLLVTGDEAPPLIAASHLLQHQLESPVGRGYLISDEPDKLIQVAR